MKQNSTLLKQQRATYKEKPLVIRKDLIQIRQYASILLAYGSHSILQFRGNTDASKPSLNLEKKIS